MRQHSHRLLWQIAATVALVPVAGGAIGQTSGSAPEQPGADRPRISGPLSVQQAVQTGLRNNPEVQGMQAEARAAQSETRATRAMTLPQISTTTTLTTGNMGAILPSSPGVSPTSSLWVPGKPLADQNLALMVPLYTGGRLSSQVRAASERARAAQANVGGAQADTSLAVKSAYYRALLGASIVEVAQARVTAASELVRTTQAQFDAGKGILASVSRVQAELADAQRMFTSATNDRAKALLDLKVAMGVNLESDITLSDTMSTTAPAGNLNADLVEAARLRSEMQAARARIEAAKAQVGAARGAFAPQVYGAAMADAFSSQEMGTSGGYTVGVTVSLPLFDAGQRRAELAQMRAMLDRAQADLASTELSVSNEVRQARLDVQTADQNYKTAQVAVTAAQQAYDTAALRVQNGKAVLVEQLDALAALTQARANLAQSQYDHTIAIARLQRAIGRI